MRNGFLKLHRKIEDWEWWTDSATLTVWIHILVRASYQATDVRGVHLEPGQCIIGRKELSKECGISERQVRTSLDRLTKSQNLTIKTTNRFSIVTVVNWELYQLDGAKTTNKTTNKRPTNDQQTTTIKEYKNIKNNKKGTDERSAFLSGQEYLQAIIEGEA